MVKFYLCLWTNSNQLEWTNPSQRKWTGNDISNNNTGDVYIASSSTSNLLLYHGGGNHGITGYWHISPDYPLHVSGDGSISGNVGIGGNPQSNFKLAVTIQHFKW